MPLMLEQELLFGFGFGGSSGPNLATAVLGSMIPVLCSTTAIARARTGDGGDRLASSSCLSVTLNAYQLCHDRPMPLPAKN
jgi:hypothetical protein